MTGIEILLALAGVAVMSMVVGGMILITRSARRRSTRRTPLRTART